MIHSVRNFKQHKLNIDKIWEIGVGRGMWIDKDVHVDQFNKIAFKSSLIETNNITRTSDMHLPIQKYFEQDLLVSRHKEYRVSE